MKRLALIILLLLCNPLLAANDFTNDNGDVVMLLRYEFEALDTDTIGTNAPAHVGFLDETTLFFEGSNAASVFTNDHQNLTEANMDADFPLKSSGGGGTFSICLWWRTHTFASGNEYICSKGGQPAGTASFAMFSNAGTSIQGSWGHSSGNDEDFLSAFTGGSMSTLSWYHIAVTYDHVTKAVFWKVWDDTAGAVEGTNSGTLANSINLEASDFIIGNDYLQLGNNLQGKLDEFVVFKRVLTEAEIDEIRSGTYDGPIANGPADTGAMF